MNWTPVTIAELARLAGKGLTSTQIAAAMDVTRGTIMGKLRREGIALLGPPAVKGVQRVKKPALAPQPARGVAAAVLALKPTHCRWPIGDPTKDDFHYCSAPRSPHDVPPYCRKHAELAVVRKKAA
jgi:GcrA cell cycle regulator